MGDECPLRVTSGPSATLPGMSVSDGSSDEISTKTDMNRRIADGPGAGAAVSVNPGDPVTLGGEQA
jgi:hypothetical protein